MHETYAPEILCLGTQSILTIVSVIRVNQNRHEFPIKQFGPTSTILCAICFLLGNVVSLFGRIVKSELGLKGICSMYESNFMLVLGVLYNFLRELPFILIALKTLRVSICFWPTFNKINVENLNKTCMNIMKNEVYFIYLCIVYVCMVIFLTSIEGLEADKAFFSFEFFCPKYGSIAESSFSIIRFVILAFVFYLSIWTYEELDFIKFFFLLYAFSNLSIIPKAIFYFSQVDPFINRLPIYYMSFIIELFNTCIIIYYSGINKIFSQPAMQGVLQSWQAFHNLYLGMDILMEFAIQKHSQYEGFHSRCLESYEFLDDLLIRMNVNRNCDYSDDFTNVKNILQKNELVKLKLEESTRQDLCRKCDEGKLEIENVRKIERILSHHCENVLFSDWKRTKSYKNLREEFIRNGDINEKLGEFHISIS